MFEHLCRYETLFQAWEKVRRNKGAAGPDGVTIAHYAYNVHQQIGQLAQDLQNNNYRVQPGRTVEIAKKDGSLRRLTIPNIEDRIVQTALATLLSPVLEPEMSDDSYAYRPGRSVKMALDRVSALYRSGFTWVVDADIDDYFDSIDQARLLPLLQRYGIQGRVLELIEEWLSVCEPDGAGLPQGSPLSPLLANIFLDDMDDAMQSKGVRLVRYADDFLILCRNEEKAEASLGKVITLLKQQGLCIHEDKTRIVPFQEGFHFLGHLFFKSMVLRQEEQAETKPYTPAAVPPPAVTPRPLEGTAPKVQGDTPDFDMTPARPCLSPRLRTLYVHEAGRYIDLRNKSLVVKEAKTAEEVAALSPGWANRIEIGPHVGITMAAQRQALKDGSIIHYVGSQGQTFGQTHPAPAPHGKTHLAQAKHILDDALRLDLARSFTQGRLSNQRALLNRLNRKRKMPEIKQVITGLTRTLKKLPLAETPQALMGLEGAITKEYWQAFARTIEGDWRFSGRNRMPPKDPVNAVLSYAASMLTRDIAYFIEAAGLHSGFAVLHESDDRDPALAFDLIEEFRAPLVEGFAVYLFNNQIMKAEHFFTEENGSCLLEPHGRRTVIRHYEKWLDREITHPKTKQKMKWRGLIEEQVFALKSHFLDEAPYAPYIMDY